MNDMTFLCEHAVGLAGGLARADIGEINQRLRHNILSARGYQQPIELTMRSGGNGIADGLGEPWDEGAVGSG
jgi:hypothetical protein